MKTEIQKKGKTNENISLRQIIGTSVSMSFITQSSDANEYFKGLAIDSAKEKRPINNFNIV